MKVNKDELLKALKILDASRDKHAPIHLSSPGEQFILTKTSAITQNEEICVIIPIETGVEQPIGFPEELIGVIKGMDSDEVFIGLNKKRWEATLKGKDVKAVIKVKADVELREPEPSKKWRKLPVNFINALDMCKSTSTIDGKYEFESCLKIEGNEMFSTDTVRVSRYQLKKKMPTLLIPTKYANGLVKMKATRYTKDDVQTYFGNDDGVIFALRNVLAEFPNCDDLFEQTGFELELPEGLIDAIKSVTPFSKADEEELSASVQVTINKNGIMCRSENDRGRIEAPVKTKMEIDEEIKFSANPEYLLHVLEDSTLVFVTEGRIIFDTPNYKQVLALLR